MFVVKSSDGTLYGTFDSTSDAVKWAEENEDVVGDWCVEEVYRV